MDLYQEYLYTIGKLKDVFKFDVDADHREIHTFYLDKKPIFKLFFGTFEEEPAPSIVVSFHIDIRHPEAIKWVSEIYKIHPLLKVTESFTHDSTGEAYLGDDALYLKEVFMTQQILSTWLENYTREDMEKFVKSKVVGLKDKKKEEAMMYDLDIAKARFNEMKKPETDDEVQ